MTAIIVVLFHSLALWGVIGLVQGTALLPKYYAVKRDVLRKCPSPQCGGYFVTELNKAKTVCPAAAGNGTIPSVDPCYIWDFDLSLHTLKSNSTTVSFGELVDGGIVHGAIIRNKDWDGIYNLQVLAGAWSPIAMTPLTDPSSPGPNNKSGFAASCNCTKDEICILDPQSATTTDSCTLGTAVTTKCVSVAPLQCNDAGNIRCPPGLTCVDDPSDDCDPDCRRGSATDCPGICVSIPLRTITNANTNENVQRPYNCGGYAGFRCPGGYDGDHTCLDYTGDHCSPKCGGRDCLGICARTIGSKCGGGGGGGTDSSCGPGLTCVDPLGDGCDLACGDTNCTQVCVVLDD